MQSYKVTCLSCNGSNIAKITDYQDGKIINLNDDHKRYPDKIFIISGRYRPDMEFGWECGKCGNYSLVAPQEKNDVASLVSNGSESALEKIKASLKRPNEKKFHMELL